MANGRGMALIPTLTISLVALLLGFSAMYVSEMGYRSISAEARWQILEKVATGQLKSFASQIVSGTRQCGTTTSGSISGVNFNVVSTGASGSCFIWSSASMNGSRVTKVAIVTQSVPTDYGAAVFRKLGNFSIDGSSSISSCDANCPTHALISGNELNNSPAENQVSVCPNNPIGVTALVDPYIVNKNLENRDLTNVLFKNIQNRTEMLSMFSQQFKVKFNNGRPTEVDNPECKPSFNINNCEAKSSNIKCECSGNNCKVDLTWNSSQGKYVGTIGGSNVSCGSIDLGQNATVTFDDFTGGGVIGANQIKISGDINKPPKDKDDASSPNLTVIARNQITDEAKAVVVNVNMFSQNFTFDNNGLEIRGGIIYSGGAGNGNLNINLNSNSYIGSSNNPTLIISDNNINIQRNGNAEINGVVFVTSANNNFSIGSGNGTFALNGMVMSNSNNNNNNGNISGNFSINFNRGIIEKLADRYNFINPPKCGSASARNSIIQTMTTVY